MAQEPRHQCLIYHGPPERQLPALAARIQKKLDENYRCLYMNSPPMVSGIRAALTTLGVNVVKEINAGRLILTSETTLAADGTFDIDLMIHKLEDALDRALDDGYAGLWASGDMAWEFQDKDNLAKLLDYEWQLEKLIQRRPEICGICQYHRDTLPPEIMRQGLTSHPALFINETLSRVNPHHARSLKCAEQDSAKPDLNEEIRKLCQTQTVD